jgi:hypothetical protein
VIALTVAVVSGSTITDAVLVRVDSDPYAVFIFDGALPNRDWMVSRRSVQHSLQGAVMSDLVYLLVGLGFFAVMALYARAAERL